MPAATTAPPTHTRTRYAATLVVTVLTLLAGLLTFNGSPAYAASPACKTWPDWSAITYGKGRFVAVASAGTYRTMTSVDGTKWTPRKAPANSCWTSVAYGNGTFVAVAGGGLSDSSSVMRSVDGITWTPGPTVADSEWTSVTYGNGQFVAVSDAEGSTSQVMTSPDGVTWTTREAPETKPWRSVAYGNGRFVAVSDSWDGRSGGAVMSSADGIAWTMQQPPNNPNKNEWTSVTYGKGKFVAVSSASDAPGWQAMTSLDGTTWTSQRTPFYFQAGGYPDWRAVTYGGGKFVAVGRAGNSSSVMVSPDGTQWTPSNDWQLGWSFTTMNSVAYGSGVFAATGTSDNDESVFASRDGVYWTVRYRAPWSGVAMPETLKAEFDKFSSPAALKLGWPKKWTGEDARVFRGYEGEDSVPYATAWYMYQTPRPTYSPKFRQTEYETVAYYDKTPADADATYAYFAGYLKDLKKSWNTGWSLTQTFGPHQRQYVWSVTISVKEKNPKTGKVVWQRKVQRYAVVQNGSRVGYVSLDSVASKKATGVPTASQIANMAWKATKVQDIPPVQ